MRAGISPNHRRYKLIDLTASGCGSSSQGCLSHRQLSLMNISKSDRVPSSQHWHTVLSCKSHYDTTICPFIIKCISSCQTLDRFWYQKEWAWGYVISWWGCKHINRSTFFWPPFISEMFQTAFHTACSNVFGSDISKSQIMLSYKITEKSPLLENVFWQIKPNYHALACLSLLSFSLSPTINLLIQAFNVSHLNYCNNH